MSRPHKATVDYFPHYVSHGKTMFTIESKFGNDGYVFWFKLLEILGNSEQHYIDCEDSETWEFLLAKTRLNEIVAIEILEKLSKLNAIDNDLWQFRIIRSKNFIENLETVYNRRSINIISNTELLELLRTKTQQSEVIACKNPQSIVEYSKVEKSIVKNSIKKKTVSKKFIPPTVEEVIEYFALKKYTKESAARFFEYYNVADWIDSKGNKLHNWKQKALAVWFKPENEIQQPVNATSAMIGNRI